MSIELLSSEIINQIAAGEVIENPAAVIKELFENSIDANAKLIEIETVNSGLTKIIVKDDGIGISKEDLKKAPLKNATSKIKTFDDLYNINSCGFRGEALASIFAVSKACIISREQTSPYGFRIASNNLDQIEQFPADIGTIVEVNDLFYNTPARKKYLKSESIELKKILDILERFSILYYNVKIIFKNDGKILINKPSFDSSLDNFLHYFGQSFREKIFFLNSQINGIKLSGFIGKPSDISYAYKKNQFFFVNSRFIKSKLLTQALMSGFGSNLMVNRHPFFVIFIEIDPEIIDVNIHPTKIEIKFENESQIYEFVKESIENLFITQSSFKNFEDSISEIALSNFSEDILDLKEVKPRISNLVADEKTYFSNDSQKHFEIKDARIELPITTKSRINEEPFDDNNISKDTLDNKPLQKEFEEYKIIGQLNKTYIIVSTPMAMYLVDQHVAEEKYYYENFKKIMKNKKFEIQKLLKPVLINLSLSEKQLFRENFEILYSLGFEIEEFGENDILVRSVPINFKKQEFSTDRIKEILENVLVDKSIRVIEEEKYAKIASISCRMSVMAGDELTMPQMQKIIENLKSLDTPFNCPHGRPTFLKYSYYELDKKFKRII